MESQWSAQAAPSRLALLQAIGRLMASVHALPVGSLRDLPPPWETFLPQQRARCHERHERLGAPPWLLRRLERYLDETWPLLASPVTPVLLTGEYTPFNLLVEPTEEGCRLSGMIDLGDAMVGPPLYDLLGPSTFLCGGEGPLIAALFEGYGAREPVASLRPRLMALLLMHRYSNLDGQVRIPGWRTRVDSIEALAELIWPG